MPKEGWSSISIADEVKKRWEEIFDLNEELLEHNGITTFSGFVNCLMAGVIHEPKLMLEAIAQGKIVMLKEFKTRK